MFAVVLVEMSDVLHDAVVVEILERLLPGERQDFPQHDGERPHVTLARVLALRPSDYYRIAALLELQLK